MTGEHKKDSGDLEKCPHCDYILIDRTTYCPYCGTQVAHPVWKKTGAWVLLVFIMYALIKCHSRLLDGFDQI
jgi:RNA polymerase subunit RPABC4/transcription elongation factor Spt4